MIKDAILSENGWYRYALTRIWDSEGKIAGFIMLNPSTADAQVDDPTIRRCIGFSKREDCGGLIVVNPFAWRATKPEDLARAAYPHGPKEVRHTSEAIGQRSGPVICAWGAHPMTIGPGRDMVDLILAHEKHPVCLGKTAAGHPRHPLYVRADQPLEPYG